MNPVRGKIFFILKKKVGKFKGKYGSNELSYCIYVLDH